jgi:hydrogenase expression/formation protein HypC
VARVVELHRDGRAVVEHDGKREEAFAMTVADEDIRPGEWVVIHSGFIFERITAAQAAEALAIRATDADANQKETTP